MSSAQEILFEVRGRLAIITLNRPKALNALTLDMALAIDAHLIEYAADDAIDAVLIKGAGERLFCAGGDIRKIYDTGRQGETYPYEFFKNEYRTNARIFHFPKPYIALMDGIVMGGGVGLSVHGTHRVVTERLILAMPETGIGFFPDVGASYFLPRMPGRVGFYMSLTGVRLDAADALYLGIGDAMVASEDLEVLEKAFIDADLSDGNDAVDRIINSFVTDAGASSVAANQVAIDRCFAADSVEGIVASLKADASDWANSQLEFLATKSPTSLKIAAREVTTGSHLDFDDCLRMEYRIANGCVRGHDFYEGVRAVVIDKDQAPAWKPPTLAEVSEVDVAAYFEDEPFGGDLKLPDPNND